MRYGLLDVTFNIPVRIESRERLRNFTMAVGYLNKHFRCNILIGEESPEPSLRGMCKGCGYLHFKNDSPHFHRTKVLNSLARASGTPIIANYDADVILRKENIIQAVDALRGRQADVTYPYSGMFRNISGNRLLEFQDTLNMMTINDTNTTRLSPSSWGGAVFWLKKSFMEVGMENENFRCWGLEDNERVSRARTLGKKITRVPGTLYHLDHSRGTNSGDQHEFYVQNAEELSKVKKMKKKDLQKYISTWRWAND